MMSGMEQVADRLAVVTGATGGIGVELVQLLAQQEWQVLCVGRRFQALDAACHGSSFDSRLVRVQVDLEEHGAAETVARAAEATGLPVALLVNGAGRGVLRGFEALGAQEARSLVDINYRVHVEITSLLMPALVRSQGRVLNLCSLVGYLPAPQLSLLAASKTALLNWSVALRREMRGRVAVTAFCPGVTKTRFLERAGMSHLGLERRFFSADPARVAELALQASAQDKAVAFTSVTDRIVAGLACAIPGRWLAAAADLVLGRRQT